MKYIEISDFPALEYGAAEELNTLCTNISFFGSQIKRIMVTSCVESEGKSFLTMNIMRTLTGLGKRVVLVDADLRRSVLASRHGFRYADEEHLGCTHYLSGMCDIQDITYSTSIPGAYIVPAGRLVSNSLSLLNTPRFSALLDDLASRVDFVIVDAPPVGLVIDAAEIAKSCDGTIFAVHYNRVRRRQLLDAKQQIERTGCVILGAVLNNVALDSYSSKRYYYKSYYQHYDTSYGGYKTGYAASDKKIAGAAKPGKRMAKDTKDAKSAKKVPGEKAK